MMSNRAYDILKTIALLVLPIGTLISTIFQIWNIPWAQQVQATFVALDVFCGALVTIAKAQYDRENKK